MNDDGRREPATLARYAARHESSVLGAAGRMTGRRAIWRAPRERSGALASPPFGELRAA
jgi:hypothetical protein